MAQKGENGDVKERKKENCSITREERADSFPPSMMTEDWPCPGALGDEETICRRRRLPACRVLGGACFRLAFRYQIIYSVIAWRGPFASIRKHTLQGVVEFFHPII